MMVKNQVIYRFGLVDVVGIAAFQASLPYNQTSIVCLFFFNNGFVFKFPNKRCFACGR
jgi:hypothetical protein